MYICMPDKGDDDNDDDDGPCKYSSRGSKRVDVVKLFGRRTKKNRNERQCSIRLNGQKVFDVLKIAYFVHDTRGNCKKKKEIKRYFKRFFFLTKSINTSDSVTSVNFHYTSRHFP